MRKVLCALCAVFLLSGVSAKAAEVETAAASAVLMDAGSGRILYEKNADEPRLIASITKLMTALVAVESSQDLKRSVIIEAKWLEGAEGSSIYLRAGESVTVEELLYGMLLESGNDAAKALACCCAGDEATFAEWMNLRAEDLGMRNSRFENASGLDADGHYSSARDMALLAAACLDNSTIARVVSTRTITFGTRTFYNHNKLLSMYQYCTGMKTGYTMQAGRTLVSSAEKDGQRLVAVTLADPDDWNDHIKLFEYGFSTYPLRELCSPEDVTGQVPVTGSLIRFVKVNPLTELLYPMTAAEKADEEVQMAETTAAPVTAGEIAGRISFTLDGQAIGSTYLVYRQSIESNLLEKHSLLQRLLGRGETAAIAAAFWNEPM